MGPRFGGKGELRYVNIEIGKYLLMTKKLEAIQKEVQKYEDPKTTYLAHWFVDTVKDILEGSEFKENDPLGEKAK